MGVAHVTVTLAHTSNLPRDAVVNSFTFITPAVPISVADVDNIEAALNKFYGGVHLTQSQTLGSYLGAQLNRAVLPMMRTYDITDAQNGQDAGSPIDLREMDPLPGTGDPDVLPSEVALALSFHSAFNEDLEFGPGSRPRARDRGRIFLGPLRQNVCVVGTANRAVPQGAFQSNVLLAAQGLRDDIDTSWSTWSRIAGKVQPVTVVSVDDAFDTVRRRGERPTAKISNP